jgi:hypothetical protein
VTVAGIEYNYWLNATSGAAESSPGIITPDTNAGNKRWILKELRVASLTSTGNITSNGNVTSAGNVVFSTAGAGVDFSVNANATGMTSELLDDYEEGTWTMGVAFGGATTGITYNASFTTGHYTKIGNIVHVTGYCVLTSKGSASGDAFITGLPFTVASGNGAYSTAALYASLISFADQIVAYADPGGTSIGLRETTNAGVVTAITNSDFDNSSNFIISLTYRAA